MKLLLDQNLSPRLLVALNEAFAGSRHVQQLGLDRADDLTIWRKAQELGFAILSKDEDFHQLAFLYGAPPKVVWLRVGNRSTQDIEAIVLAHTSIILDFGRDPSGAFLVIEP